MKNADNRCEWFHLLAALVFGLGSALVLAALLGSEMLTVQAGPLARPMLAPAPVSTDPTANATNVPADSNVSVTFDEPIDLTSITTRTFAVYGSQSPIFTGVYALSDLSRKVTLDPARGFFPGERIDAIVTTATLNITAEQATSSTVWQFWGAVGWGSGRFITDDQSIGSSNSYGVALGDLDGDGDLDALVANYGQDNKVWHNDGTGLFTETQSVTSSICFAVAIGDLNGDGDLDAFIGNSGSIEVWHNDGTGTFARSPLIFDPDISRRVALGDIDGDGDLDAFVAKTGPTGAANKVWRNDGTGSFTEIQSMGTATSVDVALGDVDGDGDLDAFVANNLLLPNEVWLNDGTGTFYDSGQSLQALNSYDVGLGDLNGDGDLDAFVANFGVNTVWENDGMGMFTQTQTLSTALSYGVTLGDVDADGDLDAFVVNGGDQPNRVWLNDGTGGFTDSGQSLGDADSREVALGDVDGDGSLDAFVANDLANRVWRNEPYQVYVPLVTLDDSQR